jgi:hypothetical protein
VVHLVPRRHVGAEPLYLTYAAELEALLGPAAYDELARLCALRSTGRGRCTRPPSRRSAC